MLSDYDYATCSEFWFYGLSEKQIISLVIVSKSFEEYEHPDKKKNYFKAFISHGSELRVMPLKKKPANHECLKWKSEYKLRKPSTF